MPILSAVKLLVFVVLSVLSLAAPLTAEPCSLCPNGEPITLPEQEISIQGFEFVNNCQALADLAPIVLQQESNECTLLQSIATLCGCPKPAEACDLCTDGSKAEYGWRKLEFLADSFGGIVPTCELVEAGLHSYNRTDGYCSGSRLVLSDYCGCGSDPGSQPIVLEDWQQCTLCASGVRVPIPNKTIAIAGFPFQTCGQLEKATYTLFEDKYRSGVVEGAVAGFTDNTCILMRQLSVHCGCPQQHESPCPICKIDNTYEVPYPDTTLDTSLTNFFMRDLEISCGLLQDIAMAWSATHEDHQAVCGALQGLGTKCGCSLPTKPTCEVCPTELPPESMGLPISDKPPYNVATCGLASVAFMFLEDGDPVPLGLNGENIEFECRIFKYTGFLCGCNDGVFTYWGAKTIAMQKAATWTQRMTAFLSLLGSTAIIVDILTTKKRQKGGMYYQIVLILSMFDILSSIAWGLGPLPTHLEPAISYGLDADLVREGEQPEVYGSHGTHATCKVQGFLLHWGFTSMLFNMSLSYFYKLSVVDGWRDSHFTTRYRVLLLGVPVIIGTGVALAAIPFITFTPVACTIGSHKDKGGWAKLIGLFYLPYGPAFIYTPLNTCYIYYKVRAQGRKGNRWRMTNIVAESNSTRIGASGTDRRGSSELTMIIKRIAKKIGRTISLSQTESQMEKLVFWQSCWYVVAFFASYSIYLVFFAMDGWTAESYWFYLLLSILTPMQGFFNGCVYFRKRMISWAALRGKSGKGVRLTKSGTMKALQRGLLWPITVVTALLQRKAPSSSNHSDGVPSDVAAAFYSPGNAAFDHDLSQPIELLNNRRANTTRVDSEEEEKVEEVSIDHDSCSAALETQL